MADKVVFKMFSIIFAIVFISNLSFSLAIIGRKEKCGCYSACRQNFTKTECEDKKIDACQRGCRFFSLVLHTIRYPVYPRSFYTAKLNCRISCDQSYHNDEASACKFGCSAMTKCNMTHLRVPLVTYSLSLDESSSVIHPGEPEPDDSLTDPGLRRQIEESLNAIFESSPKIPETHFRDLPIKSIKTTDLFKCPRFYGFNAKFEIQNGKIIIGDLYLFIGVLVFVVLCFLLGHHMEMKKFKKYQTEPKFMNSDDFNLKKPFLEVIPHEINITEEFPDFIQKKIEVLDPPESAPEQLDPKFEGISLVFHEEELSQEKKPAVDVHHYNGLHYDGFGTASLTKLDY